MSLWTKSGPRSPGGTRSTAGGLRRRCARPTMRYWSTPPIAASTPSSPSSSSAPEPRASPDVVLPVRPAVAHGNPVAALPRAHRGPRALAGNGWVRDRAVAPLDDGHLVHGAGHDP